MASAPAPIKLKLGAKASPAPADATKAVASPAAAAQSGVSVDQAALQRQKDLVHAGATPQPPAAKVSEAMKPDTIRAESQGASTHALTASEQAKTQLPGTNGVNNMTAPPQTNGSTVLPPPSNTTMPPPPNATPRITGQSPAPTQTQTPAPVPTYTQNHAPPAGFESKWRRDGKGTLVSPLKQPPD